MAEINIGDTVKITNDGRHYSAYEEWAERHGMSAWKRCPKIKNGEIGVVVAKGLHSPEKKASEHNQIMFGVKIADRYVLIGDDGVELISPVPGNGVDASGNPVTFGVDDLQLYQRVILNNGKQAIVGEDDGRKILLYADYGFDYAVFGKDRSHIKEVYAPPVAPYYLNHLKRGSLLWKSVDNEKLEAAKKAAAEASALLYAAQAALALIK